jgi:ATP-dependent DNA ligase
MHARIADGQIKLLTPTGLDWSYRYRRTIEALGSFPAKSAYLDGELWALRPDGVPAFSRLQAAMGEGRTDQPILFVFDLLYLNGESTARRRSLSASSGYGSSDVAGLGHNRVGVLRRPAFTAAKPLRLRAGQGRL